MMTTPEAEGEFRQLARIVNICVILMQWDNRRYVAFAYGNKVLSTGSGGITCDQLNLFLFRIGKSDTKQCQACRLQPDDKTPTETLTHFLFECEAYAAQRSTLATIIGRDKLNLKDIMQTTKAMKALVKYIKKTGRLE